MMSNSIVILNINDIDYPCIISEISKSEAINYYEYKNWKVWILKFHCYKNPKFLENVDIKVSSGE